MMTDEPSRAQLEWRIEELESENERLRELLEAAADYCVHEVACPEECIKCEAEQALQGAR